VDKPFQYQFEWDAAKARQNARKHRVTFERGATIFSDQNALSLFDEEHSQDEDRWVTLGLDRNRNIARCLSHLSGGNGNQRKITHYLGTQSDKERSETI
jgi:uncharacterized DUF497 family protein